MSGRPELDAAIRALVPINRLPPHDQHRVAANAKLLEFGDGQQIFAQGQRDPYVHYLLVGHVDLVCDGKEVGRVSASSKAARRALDPPGRKKLTVRAAGQIVVARFLRDVLERDTQGAVLPVATRELEVSEIAAERASDWMTRMLQSPLFASLPATNIQRIFGRMERIEVRADQIVIKQGRPGDYYYVIEQGYCEVTREIAGGRREIHLCDLGPGHAFGEAALVSGRPRDATVTMLTDGTLMRMVEADFAALIRDPLLSRLSVARAVAEARDGACWLDVRYPEEYARQTIRNSRNMPLTVLRLQCERLSKGARYLVCADDPAQAAVGAFLLIERGFRAEYLDAPVAALAAAHPELVQSSRIPETGPASVVAFPGPTARASGISQTLATEVPEMEPFATPETAAQAAEHTPLESTIERIDRLYSQKEFEEASRQRVPVEIYADTHTGRALAEIIDDIEERHDALGVDETFDVTGGGPEAAAPAAAGEPIENIDGSSSEFIDFSQLEATAAHAMNKAQAAVMAVDTRQPLPASRLIADAVSAPVAALDPLGEILFDFEQRLRAHVDNTVLERGMGIERRYQDRLQRVRQNAALELRKREAALRSSLETAYQKKELALRAHYKKLMALANKISQQKAQLQQARHQFEEKLVAVNALHRQVEEMRRQLREHLGPTADPLVPPQRRQG
ncbi:MAG TPA: cyclic nucleotide-binding domain-containing protein [Gammaproteobacteria bacterium]|nr:cyclic nucleotide-binding domain-containing protein [Gammaproteobacteria bacterium]